MKLITCLSLFLISVSALWPQPVSYKHGETVLFIEKNVPFKWYKAGASNVGSFTDQHPDQQLFMPASDSNTAPDGQGTLKLQKRYTEALLQDLGHLEAKDGVSGDDIIDYAIKSTWNTIFKQSLYPWKFHPRDWKEPVPGNHTKISEINIQLLQRDPSHVSKPLAGEVDESYTLILTEQGKASITANSSTGIAHGLTTFTQLFYTTSSLKNTYTNLAPVLIHDAPAFQHRGINLDVSRNFFTVPDIKRQIDTMAYNKMNKFHLHITDSQSWPLEIPSLPLLSANGAYRPDLTYSPADFRDLQHYAALRCVEMITEIDMPGHTASIHHSYPELIAAFNKQPDWDMWAAEPPSGTLKLNSSAVEAFLQNLLADLLPRVAPYSQYFHTGGDEVNRNAYTLDETVRSNDSAVLQPLMQRFVTRNHDQVRGAGLVPIVWEEMLLEWNLTLGPDVIVQSWQSDEAVSRIVDKGHKALVGNYNYWYLDCGKGQWLDFLPSSSSQAWPYNDYCAPYHNWRLIYSYDPLSQIPPEKHHLVLGGEAHMWAEQTDAINVDRMMWPRGAAVAEVLWSGAKDAQGRNRSQSEASPRLGEMRERLVRKGVGAEPIQMPFCTMGEGQCQLG